MKSSQLMFVLLISLIFSGLTMADTPVTIAAGNQTGPASAGMSNRTLVAWTDARAGTANKNIYGNIVLSDGSLIGSDIPFCTEVNMQYDVAAAAGARFVVAWVDERSGSPEIRALQVNSDGTMPYADFAVTSTTNPKSRPAAAAIGNDILIVWQEDDGAQRIRGHRLSWSGTQYSATGSTFDISPGGGYNAYDPDVSTGDANYLVVWSDMSTGAQGGIIGQRVNAGGTLVGDTTAVAVYSYPYPPVTPAADWDGSQWLVVWNVNVASIGSNHDVYGRYVDSGGGVVGAAPFAIATDGASNETRPAIAFDGIGFLVCWQATQPSFYTDVYGCRISGTSVGASEPLSSGTNNENYPSVAWNGMFHDVFWEDFRNTYNWDIYMSRWDQTPWDGPSAIPARPSDMGASTCPRQEAVMFLHDSDGINTSTIEFDANGTVVGIGDSRLTYANDSLRFTPTTDWPTSTWLTMCLNHAEDMTGLDILNPICWDFMIDQTDPVWGTRYPAHGSLVNGGAIPITIEVSDAGSGVSTDSLGFQVMGTWYYYGHSPAVSWNGLQMVFNPSEEGFAFEPFDTYTVCATVRDRGEFCGHNRINTCWEFFTEGNKIYGVVDLGGTMDESGAVVEATVGDSIWTDVTDIYGNYSIPGVQEVPGITVRAYKTGYADSSVVINMSSGGAQRVDFMLYPVVDLYFSDFETDNGGLDTTHFLYYNDWRWGAPTDGPGSAYSGDKCWATQLHSDYHDSSQSRLVLGPITLPESSSPILSWWQWYRFQAPTWVSGSGWQYHDGGNVKLWLSPTDSTLLVMDRPYDVTQSQWNQLIRYQQSYADNDRGNYWHKVNVNLSAWAGEDVYISWDFGSSSRNTESGWFLDDVSIGYISYINVEESDKLPSMASLRTFPNPFNSAVTINIDGAQPSVNTPVELDIFDITGRHVRSLETSKGQAAFIWDGADDTGFELPSGIYFARAKIGDETITKRVAYLK